MANIGFVRDTLYHLQQDYGFVADFYKTSNNQIDIINGIKTQDISRVRVRKTVVLQSNLLRQLGHVLFTARHIANTGTYDVESRFLIVNRKDLPKGYEITENDYVILDHKRYWIKSVEGIEYNLGYLLTIKQIKGEIRREIFVQNVYQSLIFCQGVTNA